MPADVGTKIEVPIPENGLVYDYVYDVSISFLSSSIRHFNATFSRKALYVTTFFHFIDKVMLDFIPIFMVWGKTEDHSTTAHASNKIEVLISFVCSLYEITCIIFLLTRPHGNAKSQFYEICLKIKLNKCFFIYL